ncbi:MAG: sugar phosphate nucleotidyltransferase [Candidatus Poribacteria bacterium]
MLMAAGLGTRLKPFTDYEPKALLPVMGISVAQFAIDALAEAGVRAIVANIHHHPELARKKLLALDMKHMALDISDESGAIMGSAGGIKRALPKLGCGPFFLLNADTICNIDLSALFEKHLQLRNRYGVIVTLAVLEGVCNSGKYREIMVDTKMELVTGLGRLEAGKPFFAGIAVIEPQAVSSLTEGPLEFVSAVLAPAIEARKVGCFLSNSLWFDIGSPSTWLTTHLELIEKLETNSVPIRWSDRISSVNRKVSEKIWVSKNNTPKNSTYGEVDIAHWRGPCYWSGHDDELALPPKQFGPNAVLYGAGPYEPLIDTISFRGMFLKGQ